MSDLDGSFAALLGRQPSDAERQQLYRVKEALGINNNDALWLVLMALEHYQTLYGQIPGRIEATAGATLEKIKATADITLSAAAESTKAALAQAVAAAAAQVARQTITKQMWQWITVGMVSAAAAVIAAGWTGYTVGRNVGAAVGYATARDEQAAGAWANSPDGRLAYRWAQTGELQRLARCEGATLTRERQQGRLACLAKQHSAWWLP